MSVAVEAGRRVRRTIRPQDPAAAGDLARALGVPVAMARVLVARGLADPASARAWLEPSPDTLHDPFGLAGLPEAVERLAASARRGARIVVFGDYDCDGVGALAILTTALRRLGADARAFVPHRLRDGYGLKPASLRRALEEHDPEGIVTVDCGITAVAPVAEATARGIYVVVTDHHLPPAALPQGAVLVDPKIPGCTYPFKELCGAGIAFKLAEALFVREGERVGLDPATRRRWLASFAKVAALSTIADMVPLVGENRVLVAWGLSGLAEKRGPGMAALLARAGVPAGKKPSSRDVAFRIAPRLNAAGRIDHAAKALELLTTGDPARASALADELERSNDERRLLQERVVATVLRRLEKTFDAARDALVVEAGPAADGWHKGVLGIAASRVAQETRRPVLLLAVDGDTASGSGRTWGSVPLFERLEPVARKHAREFGGHHAALGLSLPAEHLEAFQEDARAAFASARDEAEWDEELLIDSRLDPAEADAALAVALGALEPHGMGNPKPLFLLEGLVWDGRAREIGERGLRLAFDAGGRRMPAVGWNLATLPRAERAGVFDVAANLALDSYTAEPTLTVLELSRRPA